MNFVDVVQTWDLSLSQAQHHAAVRIDRLYDFVFYPLDFHRVASLAVALYFHYPGVPAHMFSESAGVLDFFDYIPHALFLILF